MIKKTTTAIPLQTAFSKLEKIVAEFEREDLDLEKAIPKFKEAILLAKELKKRINVLENQIKKI